MNNSEKTGHLYLIGTLVISLILPLLLIIFSYMGIISGVGDFVIAIAVILSSVYIIGGVVMSFIQDGEDAKHQA